MQFTFIASVLVACMTVFVSASPIPVAGLEARAAPFLPREPEVAVVAREAEAEPEPVCQKYNCV